MTASPSDAVHQQRLDQLAAFLRESEQILADWDVYSDEHTDLDGWPHDPHAYGLRASRRDADAWRAFNRVRSHAKELLSTAAGQIRRLPARAIQPRWTWQLAALDVALDQLNAVQRTWLDDRDSLPAAARPGTEAYDDARAERDAEAWHYLYEWSNHGQVLLDINTTAQHTPPRATPRAPAPAPAASSATSPTPRRQR
ncbi:hypothetical protein [Streptomyces paromomycinus]|uniref:Uncharacterized protein n=1 Tax=Streptomyces paromomycinus TaxID=92743 RepID=A0A401VXW4_STREY|nr:hypothetical protein [Streptomyces paromomycinus]GCD41875.1 hypothetical protein GKJPGBOP_01532 [Streptomyces paromomycinus]